MRPPMVFVTAAALTLGAALTALPAQMASAQSPSTQILVPSTGATVSGTRVILDAGASAGVTEVQFELSGALIDPPPPPPNYGWIAFFQQHQISRWYLHPPEHRHRRWFKHHQPRHLDHP